MSQTHTQAAIDYIIQLENSNSSIGLSEDGTFACFSQQCVRTRTILKRKLSEPNIWGFIESDLNAREIQDASQDTTELDFSFIADYPLIEVQELEKEEANESTDHQDNNKENEVQGKPKKSNKKSLSLPVTNTPKKSYNLRVRSKEQINAITNMVNCDIAQKVVYKRRRSSKRI